MRKQTFKFSASITDLFFESSISKLKEIVDVKKIVFITDENIFKLHQKKFKGFDTIVLKPGEAFKIQSTVDSIILQLLEFEADRNTILIGVGGGVVTDITGYAASIYMRGIQFGFIPTSLLAMVDACIGGKNGIDVGLYKNMIGVTRQPNFILYDISFLNTLPKSEWQNGFAEIIKHACIKDAAMFKLLQSNSLNFYQTKTNELATLIERNAKIKLKIVQADEFEKRERKLLNFGHTLGHALENQYDLSHGQAISIGMNYAAEISEQLLGFKQINALISLLQQYGLPTNVAYNKTKVFEVLKMDKKKAEHEINYILLEKIGKAILLPIPFADLENLL
jgi:3-dehydroquinate synthase